MDHPSSEECGFEQPHHAYDLQPVGWKIEGGEPNEDPLLLVRHPNHYEVVVSHSTKFGGISLSPHSPNLTNKGKAKYFFLGDPYLEKEPEPRDSAEFPTIEAAMEAVRRYRESVRDKLRAVRAKQEEKERLEREAMEAAHQALRAAWGNGWHETDAAPFSRHVTGELSSLLWKAFHAKPEGEISAEEAETLLQEIWDTNLEAVKKTVLRGLKKKKKLGV